MQVQRKPARRRSTLASIAIATAVVVGGFALFGGYIEAFLPEKEETPIAGTAPGTGQQPEVPELGWYREAAHGKDVVYMGQRYEITGGAVKMPENAVSIAGATEEDVRLYFRNDVSAANKLPATYPQSGQVGTANQWNRDASTNQGGGGGAMPYPQDKGPLYVKVGPDTFRLARPAY